LASIDLIADGLTVIRNGQSAKKTDVVLMGNKTLSGVLGIFKELGYIEDFNAKKKDKKNLISVKLKYDEAGMPVITNLVRMSKCSRRLYCKSDEIPRIANGYATVILSTSKGIMTGKKAREASQGGEALCYVM
jgi:small subunit ribosomal protein S8